MLPNRNRSAIPIEIKYNKDLLSATHAKGIKLTGMKYKYHSLSIQ